MVTFNTINVFTAPVQLNVTVWSEHIILMNTLHWTLYFKFRNSALLLWIKRKLIECLLILIDWHDPLEDAFCWDYLATEIAYSSEGKWYLDRWIPGTGKIIHNYQECKGGSKGCDALLSGTVLTNLRIIGTQGWHYAEDSWANIVGLSILTKG